MKDKQKITDKESKGHSCGFCDNSDVRWKHTYWTCHKHANLDGVIGIRQKTAKAMVDDKILSCSNGVGTDCEKHYVITKHNWCKNCIIRKELKEKWCEK